MVYCPKRLILRHLAQPILLKLCRVMTDFDNVKFSNNSIDLQVLREFCEREGETVSYRKDITFEAKK